MNLTQQQVEHIANLARLELTPEEKARYSQQLSSILEYFDQLQAIDTEDIPPMSSVQSQQHQLRSDESSPGLTIEEVLSNAPSAEERQFRVPPVFD
jgi:aspartyl-tRNA(Asn)/glutamyl-tRNA(Gln) amidotransferase subunit C